MKNSSTDAVFIEKMSLLNRMSNQIKDKEHEQQN